MISSLRTVKGVNFFCLPNTIHILIWAIAANLIGIIIIFRRSRRHHAIYLDGKLGVRVQKWNDYLRAVSGDFYFPAWERKPGICRDKRKLQETTLPARLLPQGFGSESTKSKPSRVVKGMTSRRHTFLVIPDIRGRVFAFPGDVCEWKCDISSKLRIYANPLDNIRIIIGDNWSISWKGASDGMDAEFHTSHGKESFCKGSMARLSDFDVCHGEFVGL